MWEDRIIFWIAAVLYGLSFVIALVGVRGHRKSTRFVFHTFLIGGFVFQTLALYLRGIRDNSFPLVNEFEVLQLLGWSAILLDLIIRPLFRLRLLSFFTSGLAAGLCILSLLVPGWDYPSELLGAGSPWNGFHAALGIFSYGVFGLLALTSLMYLIQHHGLEHRKSGGIFGLLPAIRQLEDINSRLILLGVGILSVAVAMGFLNWFSHPASVSLTKLLIATVVWAAYLTILLLRRSNRLLASRFARACLVLFILALASLWPLVPGNSNARIEAKTVPVIHDSP